MDELKPCPFCGSGVFLKIDNRYPQGERVTAYEVVCTNYECVIYNADNTYFLTPEAAVEAWNRRADNDRAY